LKIFGWLGAIGGLMAFLFLHDEMAALLFWIGLGMLLHASSPWKELPLWELFLTATRPFRLSFLLILSGTLIFLPAHLARIWLIRNLFEPLGVLVLVLAVAALMAATRAWVARRHSHLS
jgi:hypothetical protein